jgi:hypothetical protein
MDGGLFGIVFFRGWWGKERDRPYNLMYDSFRVNTHPPWVCARTSLFEE